MTEDKAKKPQAKKTKQKKKVEFITPENIETLEVTKEKDIKQKTDKQETIIKASTDKMENEKMLKSEEIQQATESKKKPGRPKGTKNRKMPAGGKKPPRQITIYLDELVYQKTKMIVTAQNRNITEVIGDYLEKFVKKHEDEVKALFGMVEEKKE